ncbi:DUF4352 domain-containing protein [Listeria newyorkensis]|uniref:DUF4352 domain-containing protein n=1 Tax=Listeria newyorkensis TaxID=1497681 RepID=A0A841YTD4_9LIST|nr:DUF4352 domain-containing protein [Listeria newyorkensis]
MITLAKKEKVKKPFYKKWWVWAIVVVVVAIGFNSAGGTEDKADSKTDTKNEASAPKKTASADKEKKTNKVGDTVDVGTVAYKVESKSVADTVGSEYLPENAKEKYLVLKVTIKNNGKKPITIADDFFKLMKGDTEFNTDSVASIASNQEKEGSTGMDFFYQELNPESSLTGNVVFDVPESVINDKALQLQVQTGVFGTEKDLINLN